LYVAVISSIGNLTIFLTVIRHACTLMSPITAPCRNDWKAPHRRQKCESSHTGFPTKSPMSDEILA
jgi:hypothetical protein